ncbi:MAG TPA: hypothetical protein DC048_10355, partial [Planctomycetaceae bacterium]|nr:hypothetical protein [Planctomycetaceae bacterium]
MSDTRFAAPVIPYDVERRMIAPAEARRLAVRGGSLAACMVRGADLSGRDLTGIDLRHAVLQEVTLAGCDLSRSQLGWTVFTDCDLSGSRATRLVCDHTAFQGGTLARAAWTDATITRSILGCT